ncbi:MAG: tRNA pseudouridine(38-40) synthase TruA [Pseudomonadota bacterium]
MNEKKNIRLILAYDGSRYHGWQRQKGMPTIQEEVETCIHKIINEPVKLIASGRTDAGVHALYQVCHFMTLSNIAPESLKRGLNALLPDEIFIKEAEYCPLNFHSRYNTKSKTYEYRILNRMEPDVFRRSYVWHIRRPLDLHEMKRCCFILLGKHDFSSFRSTGSGNLNPVREMMRSEIHGPAEDILNFVFEANGFLRHMVRNIVGTIVEVGRGRIGSQEFMKIFESRDRRMAGMKAPSQGLFLTMVRY